MFEEISQFTMVPEYKLRTTTFDIVPAESKRPVARVVRDKGFFEDEIWPVLGGPNLDTKVGMVAASNRYQNRYVSYDSQQTVVGCVTGLGTEGLFGISDRWTFEEVGVGVLMGQRIGGHAVAEKIATELIDIFARGGEDGYGRTQLDFRNEYSDGFAVVKPMSVNKRISVTVRDLRVDRMTLFALCLLLHDQMATTGPKEHVQEIAGLLAPGNWRRKKNRP